MQLKNKGLGIFFGSLFLVSSCVAKSADTISYEKTLNYTFTPVVPNRIEGNKQELFGLFEQLKSLREGANAQVSIIHLGDSHIQSDFLSGYLRSLFQLYFGDAGRGLVSPLKLANTNEPLDYKIKSANTWESARCIKPGNIPMGLTGLGLRSFDSAVGLSAETYRGTQFTQMKVFYSGKNAHLKMDSSLVLSQDSLSPFIDQLILKNPSSNMNIWIEPYNEEGISFYGFELQNGKPGVLYHNIGINGAHYADYCLCDFAEQLAGLQPNLFIISLGTNEAYGKNFDTQVFYTQIENTIKQIKSFSPNARFLLTTPIETFVRSKKQRLPNKKTKLVRDVIVKYAQDNHLPYWDLFTIGGGVNSAYQWQKQGLMAKDGIHFTKTSYEYQGQLLFEAFQVLYNQYITSHLYVQD